RSRDNSMWGAIWSLDYGWNGAIILPLAPVVKRKAWAGLYRTLMQHPHPAHGVENSSMTSWREAKLIRVLDAKPRICSTEQHACSAPSRYSGTTHCRDTRCRFRACGNE